MNIIINIRKYSLYNFLLISNLGTINIYTEYELDGKIIEYPSELVQDLKRCIPIYKKLPGFDENISEVKIMNHFLNLQKVL